MKFNFMKRTLLLSLFVFSALVGFAQNSFSFEHDTIITENINSTDQIIIHNLFTNSGSSEASFHWKRVIVEMPAVPWTSNICENVCYGPNVSEANFTLAAGASVSFDFDITPANLEDANEVEVHFVVNSLADTTKTVTTVYIFRVATVGTEDIAVRNNPILLYPNPTFDYINIKNGADVGKLVVYNIMGRAIKVFHTEGLRSFDISELPEGMYLVGLFDKNNNIIKTIRVSKRAIMP